MSVGHVYVHLADDQHVVQRQGHRPWRRVDVAAHGHGRRDRAQPVEDLWSADIARVDDVVRSLQRRQCLRAQQTVGVGDHADAEPASGGGLARVHGRSTPLSLEGARVAASDVAHCRHTQATPRLSSGTRASTAAETVTD